MTSPIEDAPDSAPEVEENEVLREARRARELKERAEASDGGKADGKSKLGWKAAAAAGIGVGSAALIAALLYANRDKKD